MTRTVKQIAISVCLVKARMTSIRQEAKTRISDIDYKFSRKYLKPNNTFPFPVVFFRDSNWFSNTVTAIEATIDAIGLPRQR